MLSDTKISEAILTTYTDRFKQMLSSDAVIVGGGPSGLIAAYYLGKGRGQNHPFGPQTQRRRRHVGRRHDDESDRRSEKRPAYFGGDGHCLQGL